MPASWNDVSLIAPLTGIDYPGQSASGSLTYGVVWTTAIGRGRSLKFGRVGRGVGWDGAWKLWQLSQSAWAGVGDCAVV